ncbi:MAG: histidine phosphatase family protein [Acidobacteriia bacterium]|nr:histidine phosphatase family protein [Terriglobia bacterium]
MKHRLIRIIFPALVLCQLAAAQQGGRQIFLVREAEATAPVDSPLTPAGAQRAQCLLQTLKDAGVKQILVAAQSRAALETADPLAKNLKLTPTAMPAIQTQNIVRSLIYGSTGNAVFVGNPATLTSVIQVLHAGTIQPIGPNEYDKMFLVGITEGAATPVATLRYCSSGAAPAAPAPAAAKPPAPRKPATTKQTTKKP